MQNIYTKSHNFMLVDHHVSNKALELFTTESNLGKIVPVQDPSKRRYDMLLSIARKFSGT